VKIRKPEAIEELKHWRPDVYVVAAFGQILPQEVLDIPPHGSINVHASLLPRWRGAAPIHAAIRAGDDTTGITIMKMDAGLDTGPMLSAGTLKILPDDTAQTLHDKLAQLGADLIINTLPGYLSGSIEPQAQPEDGITYAPQIKKDEGEIDWTQSAVIIERLVRAFTPWPGTYTYWDARQLKIHAGYVGDGNLEAGRVDIIDGRLAIGTGEDIYYPTMLQLEGKQSLPVDEFVRGRSDIVGVTLGHKKPPNSRIMK
jgi:methionyl-tRNA formyltransferase